MTRSQFWDRILETPGAMRFLETVQDDLATRNCVLLMTPATVPEGVIWAAIHEHLGQTFDICEIELPRLERIEPAAALGAYLEQYLGLSDAPRTVASLVTMQFLPDVLNLTGFECLTPLEQSAWIGFVRHWSEYLPSVRGQVRNPTALLLPIQLDSLKTRCPLPELYLKVKWWSGIPSVLDTRHICRLEQIGSEWQPTSQWRENLLASLVGTDLEFAAHIWDSVLGATDNLISACRDYATSRGWTTVQLRAWECMDVVEVARRSIEVDAYWSGVSDKPCWAAGVVSFTPEDGIHLHSAALAALQCNRLVKNRIWRGQISVILPTIESLRLHICKDLTESYGDGWTTRWIKPYNDWEIASLDSNPNECEIGHLKSVLHLPALTEKRRFLPAAKQAGWIRNEVAHGNPIEFDEYLHLRDLIANCN